MKKTSTKSKNQTSSETKSNAKKEQKAAGWESQNTEKGGMDFGGLPDRDLKKNLGGCG